MCSADEKIDVLKSLEKEAGEVVVISPDFPDIDVFSGEKIFDKLPTWELENCFLSVSDIVSVEIRLSGENSVVVQLCSNDA